MSEFKNECIDLRKIFQNEEDSLKKYISKMISSQNEVDHISDLVMNIAFSNEKYCDSLNIFRLGIYELASQLSIQHIKQNYFYA